MLPCSPLMRCFRPPRSSTSAASALRLWSLVVIFEHMPPSTRPRDGPAGFPPMRTSVCAKSVCPRCDQGRGGYVFLWIGIWNRRGAVVPSGLTPQQAWDRRARLDASMDLLLLQPHGTPYSAANFVPSHLWEFMQKVPSDMDLLPLQTFPSEVLYSTRHWLLGSPHGLWTNPFRAPLPDIERLPRHLVVVGWDLQSTEKRNFLQRVVAVVILRERGYERDEGFAFAFSTWEEAVAVAGHHLADAWLAVRVAQQEELLPAAARLIEGGPLVPDERPPLVRKRKGVPLEAGVFASMSGRRISRSPSSARCSPCRKSSWCLEL